MKLSRLHGRDVMIGNASKYSYATSQKKALLTKA